MERVLQDKIDTLLTKKTKRRFKRAGKINRGSTSVTKVVELIRIYALNSISERDSNEGKVGEEKKKDGVQGEGKDEKMTQPAKERDQRNRETSNRSRHLLVQKGGRKLGFGETARWHI